MSNYFELLARAVKNLAQVESVHKKTQSNYWDSIEEILRDLFRNHLPKIVSVEQGFILNSDGKLSKQCDIIVYDSQMYSAL